MERESPRHVDGPRCGKAVWEVCHGVVVVRANLLPERTSCLAFTAYRVKPGRAEMVALGEREEEGEGEMGARFYSVEASNQ